MVQQQAHFWGQVAVMRIDRPDAVVRGAVTFKNWNQLRRLKLALNVVIRQLDDTDPLQRRIHQRPAAVAADAAGDANMPGFSTLLKAPEIQGSLQAVVLVQLRQRMRCSPCRKIVGRGADMLR